MMDNNNVNRGDYQAPNNYETPVHPNEFRNGTQGVTMPPRQTFVPQGAPVQTPPYGRGEPQYQGNNGPTQPPRPFQQAPQQGYNPYPPNAGMAPTPGAYPNGQNYPAGRAPNNGYYYPQQNNMHNYGAYPYPQQKKGSSPVLYVLIAIISLCFIAAAALCVYLFMNSQDNDRRGPTEPTMAVHATTMEPSSTEMQTQPTSTMETEPPTTEPTTQPTENPYAYLDDLNRKYDNYFDYLPDENGDVLSHSSDRLISKSELYGMTEHQVCMARNEIYARHGYIFQTEKYNEYFANFSWYRPRTTTLPDLSEIESQNVKTISAYEEENGW